MKSVKSALLTKPFLLIFTGNLIMTLGQQTINTLLPKYAGSLGADSATVGLVAGIFAVSAIAVRPVASPAFDCFSKKKLLLLSELMMIISYLFYISFQGISLIIVGRLLHGASIGLAAPLALSMACDVLPQEHLGRGVSIFSLGHAFAQAVGPSTGLKLVSLIGYRKTFIICLLQIAISFVVICFCGDKKPACSVYKIRLDTIVAKEALSTALMMSFVCASYATINGFLPIYGGLLGLDNIGLFFTVYALSLLLLRPLTAGLADRFGYGFVLVPSMCCFACAFILFSITRSMTTIIIAALFAAGGYGVFQPTVQAMGILSVPPEKRGVGSNTIFLGQDVGQFLGPWLGGITVNKSLQRGASELQAYARMYRYMIIPIAIGIVVYFAFAGRRGLKGAEARQLPPGE